MAKLVEANVGHHNRVLEKAMGRAFELEGRMARVLKPILDHAGVTAASRFSRLATDHLTASAWLSPGTLSYMAAEGVSGAALSASLALTAAGPGVQSNSTMIAVQPRSGEMSRLEQEGGLAGDTLHVTLAYLGEVDGPLDHVRDALLRVGADHAPLEGVVGGIGRFEGDEEQYPRLYLPSVPGLVELRVAATSALAEAGVDYARGHGFIPHLTVAYQTPDADEGTPEEEAIGTELHFDELLVVRGDTVEFRLPLVGVKPITAAGTPLWTAPAGDELIDVDALVATLRGKTDPVRRQVVETTMKTTLDGVGVDFDVTNPFTAKVLSHAGEQITEVAATTRENVNKIINRSYEEGLSIPDTATAIRAGMADASIARATLIARTELVGAANGGSLAATQIVDENLGGGQFDKQWLTASGALNPRHELYEGLNGQTTSLDGYFQVGADQLQYPGDPAGDPSEVCNCRCTIIYTDRGEVVAESDADTGGYSAEDLAAEEEDAADAEDEEDMGLDATTLSAGEPDESYSQAVEAAGDITTVDRWDAVSRAFVDTGNEHLVDEAEYTETFKDLEKKVTAVEWPSTTAQVEAHDAIIRVLMDDVKMLEDAEGNTLGVVSFNPGETLEELRKGIEGLREDIQFAEGEGHAVDDMRSALIELEKRAASVEEHGGGVVGVNHLASTGAEKGIGTRLMREVAKVAARQGKGVGLNSLPEAESFYARLGMKKEGERGNYFWTADEAKRFADTGEIPVPRAAVRADLVDASRLPELRTIDDGAASDHLDKRMAEWGKNLSRNERDALEAWKEDSGNTAMNVFLRTGEHTEFADEFEPYIHYLDRAILTAPDVGTPLGTTMFRGVSDFSKVIGGAAEVGKVFVDKGFVSVSTDIDVARNFANEKLGGGLIKVEMDSGAKGAWLRSAGFDDPYGYGGENELLLKRNQSYVITKVEKDAEGHDEITVRLVSPDQLKALREPPVEPPPPPPVLPPPVDETLVNRINPDEERPYSHWAKATLDRQIVKSRSIVRKGLEKDPTLSSLTPKERVLYERHKEKLEVLLRERDIRNGVVTERVPVVPKPAPEPARPPASSAHIEDLRSAFAARVKLGDRKSDLYLHREAWEQNVREIGSSFSMELDERLEKFARVSYLDKSRIPIGTRKQFIRSILEEVRPVGPTDTAKLKYTAKTPEKAPLIHAMEDASEIYPTEWIEKAGAKKLSMKQEGRGYFRNGWGKPHTVALSESAHGAEGFNRFYGVAAHEMGHLMEEEIPEIKAAESEFYKRRTQGGVLEAYHGSKTEMLRRDEFVNAYIGKDYGHVVSNKVGEVGFMPGIGDNYEILTMGMQDIAETGGRGLLDKDPDMRDFIFGLLVSL